MEISSVALGLACIIQGGTDVAINVQGKLSQAERVAVETVAAQVVCLPEDLKALLSEGEQLRLQKWFDARGVEQPTAMT